MRDWTLLRAAAARVLDAVDVECDGATLARLLGVAEADAPRLVGAAPAPVPDVEFGAPGTLADALRHYDQGRFPEFLEAGLACLRSLVRDDLLMAARCAYAALAHWLRKARVPTDRREVCARVLNAGLELQQEMLHFPWRARDAAPLYYKLRALAFVLGDTRSLGLLDLAIGTLNINGRSRRKALFHHQVMRRGINTVNALGDSDILLHSSGMICFYYFVEGKFTRAINCAYSAMYMPDNALNFNYKRMLYSYAALSAVHLGEYDVAVNMLHLAIERSRKREQWLDMSSLRAILALACLLGGHEDEAFEHIDGILGMRARPALTYADVLASRVLAYYHHLRGRDRASYVCYTIWQKKAQDKGLTHSNYISAPFVLELLAAYERAGFDPPASAVWTRSWNAAWPRPRAFCTGWACGFRPKRRPRNGAAGTRRPWSARWKAWPCSAPVRPPWKSPRLRFCWPACIGRGATARGRARRRPRHGRFTAIAGNRPGRTT